MEEPKYKLIAGDLSTTGEITDEQAMTKLEYLAFLDDVEGWKQRQEGEPWSRPHHPFEDARDPREEGI
jgi:hypothetical protein